MSEEFPWLTKAEIAVLLKISPRGFDDNLRRSLPPSALRGEGKALRFNGPEVVAAAISAKVKVEAQDDDPLMRGGDSPQLERYRAANADIREMERDRQRAKLIDRDELEPALMQYADVLRGAGETLAREFGNAAADVLNQATDEFVKGVEKIFKAEQAGDELGGGR